MSLFVLNWALLASHFKQLSFHLLKHPGFPAQTLNLLASSFKYLALIQHKRAPRNKSPSTQTPECLLSSKYPTLHQLKPLKPFLLLSNSQHPPPFRHILSLRSIPPLKFPPPQSLNPQHSSTISFVVFFILLRQLCVAAAVKYKRLKATGSDQLPCTVLNRKDRNFVVPSAHKLDKDAEGVKEMSLFVLNWALLVFAASVLFVHATSVFFLITPFFGFSSPLLVAFYPVPLFLPVNKFTRVFLHSNWKELDNDKPSGDPLFQPMATPPH